MATKRKVKAIIERAGDGNYSVYMDDDDMSYLVTGTGKTAEEAIECFKNGYEDMKKHYAEEGKEFEEAEFDAHLGSPKIPKPSRSQVCHESRASTKDS